MSSFITIQDIDIPNQTFTVSAYFNIFWQVKRPNYDQPLDGEDAELPDEAELPWSPSSGIFDNVVNDPAFLGDPEFSYDEKTHLNRLNFNIEAYCSERYELGRFPYDRQFINLQLKARNMDAGWKWLVERPSWVPEKYDFHDDNAKGVEEQDDFTQVVRSRLSESVSGFTMQPAWVDFKADEHVIKLRVTRIPDYYIAQVILPCYMLVATAMTAYVTPKDSVGDRMGLVTTLMLMQTVFQFVVGGYLPQGGEQTYMHMYIGLTGFLLFVLLFIECIFAEVNREKHQPLSYPWEWMKHLDKWGYGIVMGSWTALHVAIAMQSFEATAWVRQPWEVIAGADSEGGEQFEYMKGDNECYFNYKSPPPDVFEENEDDRPPPKVSLQGMAHLVRSYSQNLLGFSRVKDGGGNKEALAEEKKALANSYDF